MLDEKTLKHIRYKFDNWTFIDFDMVPKEWCTESLLREYKHKVNWSTVFRRAQLFQLSENFLRELIIDGTFDEDIIEQFISPFQHLSESFIEEFANKLDWIYLSASQKMSEQFMDRFADRLDYQTLCINKQLSNEFIERHENKWNWTSIAEHQKNVKGYLLARHKEEMPSWAYLYGMRSCK